MSSNTSEAANITSDPSAACPNAFGLWARAPVEWQQSNSTGFTDLSCAAPSCNNYPSVLASCCGRETGDLYEFDTEVGPYVSCTLQDNTTDITYQEYQNCLIRHLVTPFKCNDPSPDLPTVDACNGQSIEPPQAPELDQQICALKTSANATRAMVSCCSGAGTNGTGIIPFDSGCSIACISDSADMQDCLFEQLDDPSGGGGITCRSGGNVEDAQSTTEEHTSRGTFTGVRIALLGGASLVAVSFLL